MSSLRKSMGRALLTLLGDLRIEDGVELRADAGSARAGTSCRGRACSRGGLAATARALDELGEGRHAWPGEIRFPKMVSHPSLYACVATWTGPLAVHGLSGAILVREAVAGGADVLGHLVHDAAVAVGLRDLLGDALGLLQGVVEPVSFVFHDTPLVCRWSCLQREARLSSAAFLIGDMAPLLQARWDGTSAARAGPKGR